MDKELLNKILPYCGYGLKVSIYDEYDKMALNDIAVIIGVRIKDDYFMVKRDINYPMSFNINMRENKPVLFPLDYLNREIETEYGKEVPLIELAKIAYNYSYMNGWVIRSGFGAENQSDCLYPISKPMFGYDGYKRFIKCFYHKDHGKEYIPMDNQWELFQYLYSRHISFNLGPDEYVSVESLEKNPYANHN